MRQLEVTGVGSMFNPFKKLRDFSIKFEKTQELRSDIQLLKSLNAKNAPSVKTLPHASPQIVSPDERLVSDTDKLMLMAKNEERSLNGDIDFDFTAEAFENKLFDEERWKGWDDERSKYRYERYRVLASYRVQNNHAIDPIGYLRRMADLYFTGNRESL